MIAAKAAAEKQAEGILIIDVRPLSTVTDFFVICTVASHRQMTAITQQIEEEFARCGQRVLHVEGAGSPSRSGRWGQRPVPAHAPTAVASTPARVMSPDVPLGEAAQASDGFAWVLMDCGDLVLHLFNPPARNFYQLEHLWADAPRVPFNPNA